MKKFTSWSFSRYTEYRQCPLKAKLNHLDKIREPPNDAMARGQLLHDQIRDFIKGVLVKLTPELKLVKTELTRLKKLFKKFPELAHIEEDWAFTASWSRTTWNDWANCVLRVKLDAAEQSDGDILILTDWKTGKFREDEKEIYLEQLELYALAAFMRFPHVMEVWPRLYYTDLNFVYPPPDQPIIFTRSQVPTLKKTWVARTKPMLNDTTFAPRPNDKCRWCFYGQSGKSKGGPGLCKF